MTDGEKNAALPEHFGQVMTISGSIQYKGESTVADCVSDYSGKPTAR